MCKVVSHRVNHWDCFLLNNFWFLETFSHCIRSWPINLAWIIPTSGATLGACPIRSPWNTAICFGLFWFYFTCFTFTRFYLNILEQLYPPSVFLQVCIWIMDCCRGFASFCSFSIIFWIGGPSQELQCSIANALFFLVSWQLLVEALAWQLAPWQTSSQHTMWTLTAESQSFLSEGRTRPFPLRDGAGTHCTSHCTVSHSYCCLS